MTPQVTEQPPSMDVMVECHSGHTYAQRPTAFWWEAERLGVAAITAEWRSPIGKHFRVTTDDDAVFELIYNQDNDDWQIRQI